MSLPFKIEIPQKKKGEYQKLNLPANAIKQLKTIFSNVLKISDIEFARKGNILNGFGLKRFGLRF